MPVIKTIGLMGAMDEEIALLLQVMDGNEEIKHAGVSFVTGTLHNSKVVVCRSGVGKVNAAATTQILVDRFNVDAIWFTGVAGAVHPDLNIGDIVISSSCQQHDIDASPLGYEKGVIPYQEVSDYPADPRFVALAQEACALKCSDHHYIVGKVLSGDQFVADYHYVALLRETMNGACVEMEGAAVAQVCYMNQIPYVVLRSMSDKADGTADVNFAEFTVMASNRSYQIINEMLERLPTVQN
ncbi:5'-methylthioadenosine/S-adenosylhomocysteine nucleosidase [compost metagenome]